MASQLQCRTNRPRGGRKKPCVGEEAQGAVAKTMLRWRCPRFGTRGFQMRKRQKEESTATSLEAERAPRARRCGAGQGRERPRGGGASERPGPRGSPGCVRELGLASVSPTSPSAPENWPRRPPPRGAVSTSRSEAGERACPAHSLPPGEDGGGRHGTSSAGFAGPGNEALTGTCGLERALRGIVGKLGGTTWNPRPFENFEKNS